jgi:hypothetical protein
MASNKIPVHIDNLSNALNIINQFGNEKLIKRVNKLNKSVHHGEILRAANKIIDQQNTQANGTNQ